MIPLLKSKPRAKSIPISWALVKVNCVVLSTLSCLVSLVDFFYRYCLVGDAGFTPRRVWRADAPSPGAGGIALPLPGDHFYVQWPLGLALALGIALKKIYIYNNYSMSPRWIWNDKITNERVARVGYNHFISNKGEWNNCFSKFSNRVLPPIFISTILQSVRKEHTTAGHTRPDSLHYLIIT